MKSKNVIKKNLISVLIFLLFVIFVFYFIFKENDIKVIFNILKSTNKFYLVVAFLCMACFSICEALNLKETLKILGNKISFSNAYKYALAGFFCSSITPSATGGDPMQLYLMAKDKVPISHSVITLLVKLLVFQLVTIIISLFGVITSYNFFKTSLGNIRFLIFLGMFLNFLVCTLYFLIIFCKPIVIFLVEFISKILHKFQYKNQEKLILKLSNQVEEYGKAAVFLKQHKSFFLKVIGITSCQMLLYYSIPYFVYLSFGYTEVAIFKFIVIQAVLFISVSSLPFPGAVGISEITFMYLYKTLFPDPVLGSAMVITRFINFYIFVLYSGITMSFCVLKDNVRKNHKENNYGI